MRNLNQKPKGFTLAELLITTVIAGILITFAASLYFTFFGSVRNIRSANNIYEETRFTMERIVKEVRENAVDYEEYYNQISSQTGNYGQNYCNYNRQFYVAGADNEVGTEDDISLGKNQDSSPLESPNQIQDELYLIDGSGTRRLIIKKIDKTDAKDNKIGRIGLIKLIGFDYGIDNLPADDARFKDLGEGDGLMDTWRCDKGFTCTNNGSGVTVSDDQFIDITPAAIDVQNLQFIISPKDDPFKAYNDSTAQIQPKVTVKLIARSSPSIVNEFKGGSTPDISLESTISTRIYQEVISRCYEVQCEYGVSEDKECPNQLGVCAGATQACGQTNTWPGCSDADYSDFYSAYEPGQESKCADSLDNDCNGLTDEDDPACRFVLCNDGEKNNNEMCADVGGICNFIHPYEPDGEVACYDGKDNDCDGKTDSDDQDCQ